MFGALTHTQRSNLFFYVINKLNFNLCIYFSRVHVLEWDP